MPKINFDEIENAGIIPAGDYNCKVADIEEKTTASGNDMWRMKLQIEDGEHAGRYIYDNLVFTERAMSRIKLVCGKLGLPTKGNIDLETASLIGRKAIVSVVVEAYESNSGEMRERATVPFAGYERTDAAKPTTTRKAQAPPPAEDDPTEKLPF